MSFWGNIKSNIGCIFLESFVCIEIRIVGFGKFINFWGITISYTELLNKIDDFANVYAVSVEFDGGSGKLFIELQILHFQ